MRWAVLVVALTALGGCSSFSSSSGSAIRTGPVQMPSYSGAVAIYSTGKAPPGAVDLGVVEVHAAQQDATIDALMPQFVSKVAGIGGNVAVIDGVRARFEVINRPQIETYYYTCNMGATCAGTRVYSANDELMTVSIFGRAFSTQVLAPGEQPLIPPGQSPDDPDEPQGDPPPAIPPVQDTGTSPLGGS